jgi:hypothetical protein
MTYLDKTPIFQTGGRKKAIQVNNSLTTCGLSYKISLLKPQLMSTSSGCIETILLVTLQDYGAGNNPYK